jgi:hypothetical protein
MVQLFVIGGSDVGRSADLPEGGWIGRAEGCALRLGDRSISRKHARVERRGDRWVVTDQGSTNGLWLDDERVTEVELVDHGEFRAGEVHLRARLEGAQPTPPSAPVGPASSEAPAARPAASAEPAMEFTSGGGAARVAGPAEELELELEWEDEGSEAAPPPGAPAAPSVRDVRREELVASLGRRRSSVLSGDLSQQPAWVKALVGLGVLAFLAALAWGVSTLVQGLR